MPRLRWQLILSPDRRTRPTYTRSQLDSPHTVGRNTTGTSQPTYPIDFPNPIYYSLLTNNVLKHITVTTTAGSAGTRTPPVLLD